MVTWWQSLLISLAPAAIAAFAAWYVAYCQIRNAKKELQAKYENENRLHIYKLRFDTEFSIYKELCEKFVTMVSDVLNLFPQGIYYEPPDEKSRSEYYLALYERCKSSIQLSNLAINKYACFISKNIYNEFIDLQRQWVLQTNLFFSYRILKHTDNKITECFLRTKEIGDKVDVLMDILRAHISDLSKTEQFSDKEASGNAD